MKALELKIPPPVVALLCAAAMYAVGRAAPAAALGTAVPVLWVALPALLGLSADLAGVWAFHRHRTTVNPLTPQKSSAVVQSGIYRFTRNPMYLGMALLLTAWWLWLGNWLSLLVLPVFVLYITAFQIKPEERILLAKFGTQYQSYLLRTRRWI
ncbi:methyltransferase family protein [Comamonas guangdongensis]|uniref:Isoprenylcysteine carboxylmethyltransferase family protein n=1 Tax=Comamonas guangdongensis TaxID=510515 RepID=A0ABV3ZY94_9BURK